MIDVYNAPGPPHFDKLNQLANFIDDLPSDHFHMPTWVSDDATEKSCGTAGCACGWAATIFQKEGFKLERFRKTLVPEFGGFWADEAFAAFFSIPYALADWITTAIQCGRSSKRFGHLPSYCEEYNLARQSGVTPRHAADRIRRAITMLGGEITEDYPCITSSSSQRSTATIPS